MGRRHRKHARRVEEGLAPPCTFEETLTRVWSLVGQDVTVSIADSGIGVESSSELHRALLVRGTLDAAVNDAPEDDEVRFSVAENALLWFARAAHRRSWWQRDDVDGEDCSHLMVLTDRQVVILTPGQPLRSVDRESAHAAA